MTPDPVWVAGARYYLPVVLHEIGLLTGDLSQFSIPVQQVAGKNARLSSGYDNPAIQPAAGKRNRKVTYLNTAAKA